MLPLLPLTLLIVGATAQGKCNHDIDYNCVDAYGVASFEFQPLFSTAPKFGYGFRVIQPGEPNNYGLEAPTVQTGPQMDMNVWLEYEGDMNLDKKANRTGTFATIFTNATGTVGGANNGCEGLLGAECAKNLQDVLKWALVNVTARDAHFRQAVQAWRVAPPTNLSCPAGIMENFWTLDVPISSEYEDELVQPRSSGNATDPWIQKLETRSAEQQMGWAAVGVVARHPDDGGKYEDVQLEIVCLRPTPVEGSEDRIKPAAGQPAPSGSAQPKPSNDGSGLSVPQLLVWGLLGCVFLEMM